MSDVFQWTHTRDEWQNPLEPIKRPGQAQADWRLIDQQVIHYTADDDLPDGDLGENLNDVAKYLRAIQHSYLVNKGYSFGYNAAVDWLGGTWEGRGFDIRCAANDPQNVRSFAVLMLVDGNDPATDLAIVAVQRIYATVNTIAMANNATKVGVKIIGHKDIEPTGCPGTGLYLQVAQGVFYPPKPQLITTITEEDDMRFLTNEEARTFRGKVWQPGYIKWALVGTRKEHMTETVHSLLGKPAGEPLTNAELDDIPGE